VSKERQQSHDVVQIRDDDAVGVAGAAVVQQVAGLGVHQHKLHHLTHGEGRLPPNLLGVQGNEVVGVHDGVDDAVQHDGQVHVSVIADVDVQPIELKKKRRGYVLEQTVRLQELALLENHMMSYQENTGVVVDVQEAELLPSLF